MNGQKANLLTSVTMIRYYLDPQYTDAYPYAKNRLGHYEAYCRF